MKLDISFAYLNFIYSVLRKLSKSSSFKLFDEWQWEPCSVTCGVGIQEGRRRCAGEAQCNDNGTETITRQCIVDYCKVDGKWSNWSLETDCSVTCGRGIQVRYRECSNPYPKNGGRNCTGNSVETVECVRPSCCPEVNVSLTNFKVWQWTVCSVTCGIGIQDGQRTKVVLTDDNCIRPETETMQRLCFVEHCKTDGHWSNWADEGCSVTCGKGIKIRHRNCSDPYPQFGGKPCDGHQLEVVECSQPSCCPANDNDLKCKDGWIQNDKFGACYCFSLHEKVWKDAQDSCRDHSASLVYIYSKEEDDWLVRNSREKQGQSVWIGGKRVGNSYKWILSDGNIYMNFTHWAPGEPKTSSSHRCVDMWYNKNNQWDDMKCNKAFRFICKKYM